MTAYTRLFFGDHARSRVLVGPEWGTPFVSDDGVTMANQIHLKDPEQNLDAQMLRQAAAIAALEAMARPVSSRVENVQVATVSAHGHSMLGERVGDAVDRVGGDGVVTVEEAMAGYVSAHGQEAA